MRLNRFAPAFLGLGLAFALNTPAEAKRAYGMAGCGLGSMVFGTGGSQTSAATTNDATYTKGFGITSGTSNCKTPAEMAAVMKQEDFLVTNLTTLQKEMAQGEGGTITAFTEVLGCSDAVRSQASATLIKSYEAIFSAPGISQLLDTAKDELSKDQELAKNCSDLG